MAFFYPCLLKHHATPIAIALAKIEEEKQRIMAQAVEVPSEAVAEEQFSAVE